MKNSLEAIHKREENTQSLKRFTWIWLAKREHGPKKKGGNLFGILMVRWFFLVWNCLFISWGLWGVNLGSVGVEIVLNEMVCFLENIFKINVYFPNLKNPFLFNTPSELQIPEHKFFSHSRSLTWLSSKRIFNALSCRSLSLGGNTASTDSFKFGAACQLWSTPNGWFWKSGLL